MRLNTIRKAAHQITQLENGAKVVTAASNSSVAAVGLVSNAGSRSEAVSGSASINRSITLGALGSHPGVNVKSVLHRERVGVYGVTVPSNAGSVAAALVDAANTREVTQADRDHALAALNGASGQERIVTEDYLHMTGFQGTALGNSPFGTTSGILDSGSDQVLNFRANNYGAESVIVVGTGNVDHDALCAAAEGLTAVSIFIFIISNSIRKYDFYPFRVVLVQTQIQDVHSLVQLCKTEMTISRIATSCGVTMFPVLNHQRKTWLSLLWLKFSVTGRLVTNTLNGK